MKKQENDLVVKSNRLVEASYRLDIAEQRMILMAINNSRESGLGITADNFLTIRADEYAVMFDIDMNTAYDQLKSSAKTLFHRYVVLHGVDAKTGKESLTEARWVSAVTYVEGAGLIKLQFGGVIVPYITRLEGEFTSYKIKSIAKMTSTYAIRLYELLMQWKDVGKRSVDLDELKNMLGVSKEYPALFNFKARVLDVAVSQVNQFSDLDVRYENVKFGRKVTGFTFFFGVKEPEPAPKPQTSTKKAKAPAPQKQPNIAAFAGLEAYAFKALVRDFDFMTEEYVRQMMDKFGLDATATMKRLREDMSPDNFVLEKTD